MAAILICGSSYIAIFWYKKTAAWCTRDSSCKPLFEIVLKIQDLSLVFGNITCHQYQC